MNNILKCLEYFTKVLSEISKSEEAWADFVVLCWIFPFVCLQINSKHVWEFAILPKI